MLFVAHREEILDHAMRTYRTLRPGSSVGKYTGTERTLDADILLAAVQTLGRQRHLGHSRRGGLREHPVAQQPV